MNVDNLMNRLLQLRCSFDKQYKVISHSEAKAVQEEIEAWLATEHDTRLAALEAKVTAYEAIIANSNFAAVLTEDETSWRDQITDVLERLEVDVDSLQTKVDNLVGRK